jgi:propanediol dehydratase small subunit
LRLHIDYSGQFGINTAPVAGHEIHTLTGAYEMAGSWVDASSRELKDNIVSLTSEDAAKALAELNPVRYNYKVTPDEGHVGFIAEDVPELVAMKDRKGLSPMDIVAVLTKAVQEQKQQLVAQDQKLQAERARGDSMEGRLQQLAAEVARLQARVPK